ncbi:DUF6907 domain-containing protein [Streptomyces sp. NPDC002680]|uniref:DUF6907 domain-containing protein n=1 Tax=Streptomyces sp. NPDC002680 TaxID=3364659 RepID=UPI0036C00A8A
MSNDDEQERAQRSVERMFPAVARFLGQTPDELPAYGPTEVFREEDVTADVVVRVAFALSREQLFTALSVGFTELIPSRTPESLTVEETRSEVEGWLHGAAVYELDQYVQQGQLTAYPVEAQPVMDALSRALDLAYPPAPVAEPRPVQQPRYGEGTVTLQTLDCGEVTVDEPAWCLGHDGEQVVQRVDITHVGRTVAAEVETDGGTIEFLPARIAWGPFAELRPEPYPLADVDDFPAMGPGQLREFAAELALHAGRLYALSNELDRLRRTS